MSRIHHESEAGTTYNDLTDPEVEKVLDQLIQEGFAGNRRRVWIAYGDPEKGRLWGDVETGYVGRSTGRVKVPLIVHNSRSTGGPALLEHCIMAIRLSAKVKGEYVWLYRHPTFTENNDD